MKDAVALDSRLYEQVAAHVEALVQHGSLRPGDRVPSLRVLRRQHGVSLATVVRAYRELEARGVIEARPQSGFFARSRPPVAREPAPPRESVASMPASVDALVGRLYDMIRDPSCVPLGAAVPAPSILPMERLNATLASIARTAGARGATYESSSGPLVLRRQLAKRATSWGCALGPEDFVTTLGATEAMALAIRATTKPGDVVAVESPTYFGFLELLESQGLRALEIPVVPGRGFDVDALGRALGREKIAAVITTPSFHNPTGVCMPDADKARLVTLLAQRGIPLIEDDVYGDLAFDGGRPRPAKAFDREGNVLLCGSVSKTLAAGYRVGWIAPGRFETAVLRAKRANTMEGALLPQLAVAEFFATGAYDRHLRVLRRKLGCSSLASAPRSRSTSPAAPACRRRRVGSSCGSSSRAASTPARSTPRPRVAASASRPGCSSRANRASPVFSGSTAELRGATRSRRRSAPSDAPASARPDRFSSPGKR